MILHSFFRSSAAWRVRIALALKHVDTTIVPRNFRTKDHRSDDYLRLNPQGLLPALEVAGVALTQSLAIIEYLDETIPEPALLPASAIDRARVRAMAQVIACDIHPVNNLRILDMLRKEFGADEEAVGRWYCHWIGEGFVALEAMVDGHRTCFGGKITIADICLVPQMYNARRFNTDLSAYPKLVAIDANLQEIAAFADTVPERQIDAV